MTLSFSVPLEFALSGRLNVIPSRTYWRGIRGKFYVKNVLLSKIKDSQRQSRRLPPFM